VPREIIGQWKGFARSVSLSFPSLERATSTIGSSALEWRSLRRPTRTEMEVDVARWLRVDVSGTYRFVDDT
jgi:hypothetical protein